MTSKIVERRIAIAIMMLLPKDRKSNYRIAKKKTWATPQEVLNLSSISL
jgi:hypothetical protein